MGWGLHATQPPAQHDDDRRRVETAPLRNKLDGGRRSQGADIWRRGRQTAATASPETWKSLQPNSAEGRQQTKGADGGMKSLGRG